MLVALCEGIQGLTAELDKLLASRTQTKNELLEFLGLDIEVPETLSHNKKQNDQINERERPRRLRQTRSPELNAKMVRIYIPSASISCSSY